MRIKHFWGRGVRRTVERSLYANLGIAVDIRFGHVVEEFSEGVSHFDGKVFNSASAAGAVGNGVYPASSGGLAAEADLRAAAQSG
ncbi:hypothetical protein [Hymenobacter saemangeumensis]|uniref:hypothetical protein n=1 Tax=Hymenobacter saemangeumensis TaxID=1084522 RepID=UPI0031EDA008